jgi:CRISPR/Cas system-associated protein Cas7 (RAMP superfamily)
MKVLEKGLKAAALKLPTDKRSYYRKDEPDYNTSVFRVSGVNDAKGFYSYIYRGNQSNFASVERLSIQMTGYEFANGDLPQSM